MTDETMVSLAEVEASLIKHMNYEGEARLYRIMAELTPKPEYEFKDGQVGLRFGEYVVMVGDGPDAGTRPLNQIEVGDSWVPRAEFERLRDGAEE